MDKRKIVVTNHYCSEITDFLPDIHCPECGKGIALEDLKHWEDNSESEVGDCHCQFCEAVIAFEKSTQVSYTVIVDNDDVEIIH